MADAFLRSLLMLLLERSPMTPRQLAEASREELARVSEALTVLEKEGRVHCRKGEAGIPMFTVESIAPL